jgi:membrane protease YdiL (CAAX protease family)
MLTQLRSYWRTNFDAPLKKVDAEMRRFLAASNDCNLDRKTIVVMLTATVALAIQNYIRSPLDLLRLAEIGRAWGYEAKASEFESWLYRWDATRLDRLTWWVYSTIATYIVIPMAAVKLLLRERLIDYGLKLSTALSGWPVYGVMAACMFPIVTLASSDAGFLQKYPFYPLAPGEAIPPDFVRWELLYAMQFVGLEFFFRGFMVHGLRHRFGVAAVFVMTLPYCMIHFGKPFPETMAAIIAGLVLGVMSLKTQSIWLGAALHIAVAWTMDFQALWRKGFLSF